MGFLAAAIPIATSLLGAMSKDEQQQQAPVQAPPGLGEMFAMNERSFQPQPFQQNQLQPVPLMGVGSKGQNG